MLHRPGEHRRQRHGRLAVCGRGQGGRTARQVALNAAEHDEAQRLLGPRPPEVAGRLHHFLEAVDFPLAELECARTRPASAEIVQFGVIERQGAQVGQLGRVGEPSNRLHHPALLEVRDPAYPRDKAIAIDSNGQRAKHRNLTLGPWQDPHERLAAIEVLAFAGSQADGRLEEREGIPRSLWRLAAGNAVIATATSATVMPSRNERFTILPQR